MRKCELTPWPGIVSKIIMEKPLHRFVIPFAGDVQLHLVSISNCEKQENIWESARIIPRIQCTKNVLTCDQGRMYNILSSFAWFLVSERKCNAIAFYSSASIHSSLQHVQLATFSQSSEAVMRTIVKFCCIERSYSRLVRCLWVEVKHSFLKCPDQTSFVQRSSNLHWSISSIVLRVVWPVDHKQTKK